MSPNEEVPKPDFDIEAEKIKLTQYLADENSRMPVEDRAFLVSRMIGRPDPVRHIWQHQPCKDFIDALHALRYIDGYHLLNGRFGWLDRKAKLWSCAYAAHEKMCRFFGWEEKELERAGWVRIAMGPRGYFIKRPSKKQIAWMKERKILDGHDEPIDSDIDILENPTVDFKP